jgi:hypothetical protein
MIPPLAAVLTAGGEGDSKDQARERQAHGVLTKAGKIEGLSSNHFSCQQTNWTKRQEKHGDRHT